MDANTAQVLPYLVPLLILVLVMRRSLRERRLKVERLWVLPVVLLLVGGLAVYNAPPRTPAAIGAVAGALVLGAAAGWWRGRLTRITVDPDTHLLTSKTSPLGVLLITGLYVVRYVARMYAQQHPAALPADATAVTDGLMVFAIVMMAVQRLEMWLRSQRLVAEAVKAKAG